MNGKDLGFGSDGVADVHRSSELPVLTQKHRSRSRHVHRDQRVQQPGGEPALYDKPAELRARGERGIEMQRVARSPEMSANWLTCSAVSVRLREARWPTVIDM